MGVSWLRAVVLTAAASVGLANAGFAPGELTRSDVCATCHRDIHRMWRASAHATSLDSAVFLEAYHDAESSLGTAMSRQCLSCHAPAIAVNQDVKLALKTTWEGVSCDVCHSLASVDLTATPPRLTLKVGPVKRGPIRDAASSAHDVLYSELHTSATICAGCHEYTNLEGTPIITTYSEWKESAAAKQGKSCQACHMEGTRADVVDPRVKRVALAEVNLHEMPGGHSLSQLHKALGLSIQARRDGDALRVEVSLVNKGAGHTVPTGMPGRRVILAVGVQTTNGKTFEDSRVYAKVLGGADGKPVPRDSGNFAKGVRIQSDTRIKAGEKRNESFRFDVPAAATAFITVKLHYEHKPLGGEDGRTWITFQSESRTSMPEGTGSH